ncbi:hypothetical protein B0H19DRAFT_574829 [Mycena capillaripes]|nr:hypothetical protein B0H19DRAFT_574829 [Mycena capillaripes]
MASPNIFRFAHRLIISTPTVQCRAKAGGAIIADLGRHGSERILKEERNEWAAQRTSERREWAAEKMAERKADWSEWAAQRQELTHLMEKQRIEMEAKIETQRKLVAEGNEAAKDNLRKISDLEIEVKRIQNNLNLRSGIEIVAEVLRLKSKQPPIMEPALPVGVQPVLDAIGNGSFDSPGVLGGLGLRYQDVEATIVAAVAAGGEMTMKSLKQTLNKIYGELSKYHPTGISHRIVIQHGEQTIEEAVVCMSVLLFARRLFGCRLDAVYTDSTEQTTIVSQL